MRASTSLKAVLFSSIGFTAMAMASAASAQDTPPGQAASEEERSIVITGSRIRQDPNNSALPLQIVTGEELRRNSISSPEQLMMLLTTNGSGPDNLASNADVVTGAQRGTNGLSAANLRGQGNAATLVLLNGRRVAAHGLSGSAVDVNQIPFSAIERVEVLRDGASAIYGTDAVGGVINFITRTDYEGLGLQAFTDITDEGDAAIYRVSAIAGYGDLDEQGFNIMAAVSYSWNSRLDGDERAFVNGNQPNRGLSIDTRGAPVATAFNIGANAFQQPAGTLLTGLTLTLPNGANGAAGGINILDLPGGAGCESMDGGMAYDEVLWNLPTAQYACAWDTGRSAVIQQPIETLTYYARGVLRIAGEHQASVEITGSDATSAKSFSEAQLSANTTNLPIAYPLTPATAEQYNAVFNAIRAAFPNPAQQAALDARYGRPIAYRWRCIACGRREYVTQTETFRVALGLEGPLFDGWDYRAGASYARSEASSVLGSGYYYRGTLANGASDPNAPIAPGAPAPGLVGVMNSGVVNPFSAAQSPAALAALAAVSAEGETLYGGRYQVRQLDASVSGDLFQIWGGPVRMAAGVDYRRETYEFNGSPAAAATAPVIFLAAFDNVNALTPQTRNVLAAYAEILFPITRNFDITLAGRIDDYTGFGTTENPKVSFRWRPWEPVMFRGSYNTSFRVPTFNQIFNGATVSPSAAGAQLVDPFRCPSLVVNNADANCANITPDIITGGNLNLGPETAEQFNVGVVITPAHLFSLSVDWWMINTEDTIIELSTTQLLQNAQLFPDRFQRDGANNIIAFDRRWINAGRRRSQGIEISFRGGFEVNGGARILAGLDGTYWLRRREALTQAAPLGPSLIGLFTLTGDLTPRWKHNAFISYQTNELSITLTQIFRNGYRNFALPGSAARPDYNPRVDDYTIYNLAVGYNFGTGLRLTAGVRNLFDRDPPFAITYDSNTGAGSSWEPRIADPRGRSFTFAAEVRF